MVSTGSGMVSTGSGMVSTGSEMVYTGSGVVYTGIRNGIHQKKRVKPSTSDGFVMKYFKLYTEWAVSHSVFSRLGRRLMMEDDL